VVPERFRDGLLAKEVDPESIRVRPDEMGADPDAERVGPDVVRVHPNAKGIDRA
jgi:hypothetical protein